ncbi:MAG: B12-binding domain-containing radical SAM protein [Candidatus Competibacterales bacterium]
MASSLLLMAPFWDPYCPPLGIASIQAYMRQRGRSVNIFDFNTDKIVWRGQRQYFDGLVELIPRAKGWNIMRLGPDYFARHQMAWLRLRHQPQRYRELVAHILNIDGRQELDPNKFELFDQIFANIYRRIEALLEAQLRAHSPTVVGCTLLTTTLPASLHILSRAKAYNPAIRTALGGPGPIMGAGADSPDTHRLLELCPWVDNVIIGEGEVLTDALHHGLLEPRRIYSLKDVSHFAADPRLVNTTTKQGLIRDIGKLPTPDYSGLQVSNYPNLSIGVTRGCAYQCAFCYETTFWKRYRKRPVDGALDDMQWLRERYDRKNFFLCDSLANLFGKNLATGILERGMDIKWDAYLRADAPLMDRQYVQHLAAGGMVRARIGVESADEQTLQAMDKRTTAEVMGVVVENLAQAGIETSTLWIVGFPEEDEVAFEASLDFMRQRADDIYAADPWIFIFHPTVGNEPVFGRLVGENSFEAKYGMRRLYPETFDEALIVQYYELDIPDVVSMKIDRLERMCAVMRELGIPNPYSMKEWRAANRRWQARHRRSGASPLVSAVAVGASGDAPVGQETSEQVIIA